MKRKMTLSLMLTLSMLLSLVGFAATAQGQQQKKKTVAATCSAVMGAIVCRHTVASEGMSAPVTLGPNEAASLDVRGDGNGVEVMVFSNDTSARVLAQIIDTQTGNVVAVWTACGVN